MVFVLLTLLSMISGSIHVAANGISFFLCLSSIQFCMYVCVRVYINLYIRVCRYVHIHKPDLYPFFGGCLGYCLVLAIVNSAAVKTGVHVSLN